MTLANNLKLSEEIESSSSTLPVPQKKISLETQESHAYWQRLVFCSQQKARALVPHTWAEEHCVLPLQIIHDNGGVLLSALFPDTVEPQLLQELRFLCGVEVLGDIAPRASLARAVRAAYRGAAEHLSKTASQAQQHNKQEETKHLLLNSLPESPIPELLRSIVERSVSLQASDIHLEPHRESAQLRFRVDGFLRQEKDCALSSVTLQSLARLIKVLCKLDTTKDNEAQDGSFSLEHLDSRLNFRASFIPTIFGEKIVLRHLPEGLTRAVSTDSFAENPFAALGLSAEQQQLLRFQLAQDSGVIVLCGPTGSGKSTLLYTALEQLNEGWRNIVTIEDPVERQLAGICQTQVKQSVGLTFRSLLTALLRQDPDVIMVGEMRDLETAETAFTAGITGHLVLSTLHANDCLELFYRLLQLGVQAELLALSLKLAVAQRLLAKNCPHCQQKMPVSESFAKFFKLDPQTSVVSASGCSLCEQTGLSGRIGIFEFLAITPVLRELLRSAGAGSGFSSLSQELRSVAAEAGYEPLRFRVRDLLLRGIISPQTALRALGLPSYFFSTQSH